MTVIPIINQDYWLITYLPSQIQFRNSFKYF